MLDNFIHDPRIQHYIRGLGFNKRVNMWVRRVNPFDLFMKLYIFFIY
jgi:hypothetical protein